MQETMSQNLKKVNYAGIAIVTLILLGALALGMYPLYRHGTAKIKEAPAHQKTIFEWAEGSNAARDYEDVVEQLWSGTGSVKIDDDKTRLSHADEAVA